MSFTVERAFDLLMQEIKIVALAHREFLCIVRSLRLDRVERRLIGSPPHRQQRQHANHYDE